MSTTNRRRLVATALAATALGAGAPANSDGSRWGGAYGGLTFGAIVSDGAAERTIAEGFVVETDVRNGLFPSEVQDDEGAVAGGLLAGYLFGREGSPLTGGIEADLTLTGLDQAVRFSRVDPEILVGLDTNTTYVTEIDALATLRLRAGYALGDTLLFATGGLAAGHVGNDLGIAIPDLPFETRSFREEGVLWGYALGGGVERRLASGLRMRAEGLYYDLEDVEIEAVDEGVFPGNVLGYELQNDGLLLRLGLTVPF